MDLNLFGKTDEKELQKKEKEVQKVLSMTGAIARNCLRLSQFQKYKKQYQSAEEKMIKVMEKLTDSFQAGEMDITTYGCKMLVYMTRLKDLRMLIDVVEIDSRKGKKDAKEEEET